jgi:transmembrane sensor
VSKLAEFPDLAAVREQAATWIARQSRGLTAAEQVELRRWQAKSINARTLQQMTAMWDELDVMKVLADVIPDTPAAAPQSSGNPHWRPALAASLVAALALLGGGAWWYAGAHRQTAAVIAAEPAVTYTTAVGEHRNLPLADGSMLAINTDSMVEVVAMSSQARELRLLRGEAHFSVAHDPARPFRVNVGGHVVQAVGTAFDVRLHGNGVLEVTVNEGRVKLLQGGTTARLLDRGQTLRMAADGAVRITQLEGDALAARLAWRSGMLVFNGETLATALEEFSRYTAVRFRITDPQLQRLRIGGYFPAGNTDVLLETLRTDFGLHCVRGADGVIRIGPGRKSPNG